MLSFKLALKNLLGAGMKTWLNVIVLSLSFVIIIFYNGMMDGWNKQAIKDTKAWEIGNGQLWHKDYDPFDPYTLEDAHAVVSTEMQNQIQKGAAFPILVRQASIYPEGRLQNILLRGIPMDQQIVELPTTTLNNAPIGTTAAIIGKRMARNASLKEGDKVLLRWRDKNGTFDAREIYIQQVFDSNVPAVDAGQIWISMKDMYEMTGMTNEATLLVTNENYQAVNDNNFVFQSLDSLLADLAAIIQTKKGSMGILYVMLMGIALLAIFDTQILSIFRRQKEIGTYIALGMTRSEVVKLFTIEGGAHSILAAIVGSIYAAPLFWYVSNYGIPVPSSSQATAIPISNSIIPVFSLGLILGTTLLIVIAATIVSYMPARKIAYMKPTEALKGRAL